MCERIPWAFGFVWMPPGSRPTLGPLCLLWGALSSLWVFSPLRSSLPFPFFSNLYWILCYSVVASAIISNPNSCLCPVKGKEVGMRHTSPSCPDIGKAHWVSEAQITGYEAQLCIILLTCRDGHPTVSTHPFMSHSFVDRVIPTFIQV